MNQQCVLYHFQCNLCDADYVGFTCRHLHQPVGEHKGPTIGNHVIEEHGKEPQDIELGFKILQKCQRKLYCLIFELLFY